MVESDTLSKPLDEFVTENLCVVLYPMSPFMDHITFLIIKIFKLGDAAFYRGTRLFCAKLY